jgi:hypothetical protein
MNSIRLPISIAFLCAAASPCNAMADDLPILRKGMWEYNRSVEDSAAPGKPTNINNKKCADPTANMKKMNEAIAKQGCKFSPIARSGNTYTFTTECQAQGAAMQSRSVITVENDSAYKINVTSTAGARSTKEILVAKRVGDC